MLDTIFTPKETMYKKEPTLIYDSGWIDAK